MSTDAIVRLKVTLDDVKPAVMRRLEVPLNLRLDRLHLVLQAAIGWTNSHLWEIRVRDIGWGPPQSGWDLGGDVPLKASKASLLEVIDGQDRARRRSSTGSRLSPPDRGPGPLPARRRRRTLGLCRVPRGHHRSRTRAPCRADRMVRRHLRSSVDRARCHRQRTRQARSTLVSQASRPPQLRSCRHGDRQRPDR